MSGSRTCAIYSCANNGLSTDRRPSCRGVDRNIRSSAVSIISTASPFVQGRGSKRFYRAFRVKLLASPLCKGVDRNLPFLIVRGGGFVAPCAGRGSKPLSRSWRFLRARSPLCMGVDRNTCDKCRRLIPHVAPDAWAWIETSPTDLRWVGECRPSVATDAVAWIEKHKI